MANSKEKKNQAKRKQIRSRPKSKVEVKEVIATEPKGKTKFVATSPTSARLQKQITKQQVSTTKQTKQTEGPESEGLSPEKLAEYYVSPPKRLLQSFRDVAKQNRSLAKQIEKDKAKKGEFLARVPKKGKKYTLDLRIHSPATEGYFSTGGVEAGAALVRLAKAKGLDAIAITDFNTASYIDEVQKVGSEANVRVIPGVTLRCQLEGCTEVYIVALFPEYYSGIDIERILSELEIPADVRGKRDYCVTLSFDKVVATIEENQGLIIPSRLDKTPYRQIAIPILVEKYGIRAFDLVHIDNMEYFRERWPGGGFTFFTFSKANALAQVGNRVAEIRMTEPGFAGIKELVQRRAELSPF